MAQTVVDVVIRTKGQSSIDRLNKSLGKTDTVSRKLAQGLGGAITKLSALAGVTVGLSQAFQTLEQQDFAIAKVKSLGVNSQVLLTQLKEVSKELKGQASVAELTGASYDVASAGFTNAADAAKVLKASSLGATAGFSDINTVANATTSVLNAYGLSADKAGKLVDGFVQTQNDGKIVIAEYANNIGKLAPIAASLSVPLEEINAAIAAVTASGVNAEIGITGIRSGLAKLGANSKDATEILAGYGLTINATTIANEGLIKTLEKLSKVSNQEDLLKIVGVEAGQAIAPLLNDLEKLNRLVENQENAFGTARKGAEVASNSIRGSIKKIDTAFSNLLTSADGVSKAIIPLFNGLAGFIEALNSPMGEFIAKVGGAVTALYALQKAIIAVKATAFAAFVQQQIALFTAFGPKIYAVAAATGAWNKALLILKGTLAALPFAVVALLINEVTGSILDAKAAQEEWEDKMGTTETAIIALEKKAEDLKQKLDGVEDSSYGAATGTAFVGGAFATASIDAAVYAGQLENVQNILAALRDPFDGANVIKGFDTLTPREIDEALDLAGVSKPKPPGPTGPTSGGGAAPRNDTKSAQQMLQAFQDQSAVLATTSDIERELLEIEQERAGNMRDIADMQGIDGGLRDQLNVAADLLAIDKERKAVLDFVFGKVGEAVEKQRAIQQAEEDTLRPLQEQRQLSRSQTKWH